MALSNHAGPQLLIDTLRVAPLLYFYVLTQQSKYNKCRGGSRNYGGGGASVVMLGDSALF